MTHEDPIIQTTEPKNLCELLAALDGLADLTNPTICRGQSIASWRLQPSLDRNAKPDATHAYAQRLADERCLVDRFHREAEHLLGAIEWKCVSEAAQTDLILPMTVMQHFGASTRLLDWTRSAFVAAFFAAVDNPGQDGAVWWYRKQAFDRAAAEEWRRLNIGDFYSPEFDYNRLTFREDSREFIGPVLLKVPFRRAEVQQGQFTIAGRLGLFHDDLLLKLVRNESFGKIVISSRLKRDLLKALRARTVTATSLEHVGADRLGFKMSQERRAESVPRSGA